jgi:sugar phosphate isomerase/epimerase
MSDRRHFLKTLGAAGLLAATPFGAHALATPRKKKPFRYCLNTSTISGQKPGIERYIEIAAEAGYDGIEIWVRDLKAYIEAGRSTKALAQQIRDAKLTVENAIGFAPWMVEDETQRRQGFQQLEEEMNLLAEVDCLRIAAPPAGVSKEQPVDLFKAGERYQQALELGRKTGVMPQLEFWGASGTVYHLSQALAIAAAANDPDARLLPDIYHLFRGGSGFDGLRLIEGKAIEIFHFNDYTLAKPREEQKDSDRIYPGDGDAPLKEVAQILRNMGGPKVLSVELFNPDYWQQDPLQVARTALQKMKAVTAKG